MELVQMPRQQGKTRMIARSLFRDMDALAFVTTEEEARQLTFITWGLFKHSGNEDVTTEAEIAARIFYVGEIGRLRVVLSARRRAILPTIHVDEIDRVLDALLGANVGLVTYSPEKR